MCTRNLELWSLLKEVLHGLFKETIVEPLKFKMAEIHHLESHIITISQRKIFDFDEIWYNSKFGTQ